MISTMRSKVRRIPERGTQEWQVVSEIFDACFLASVGFCVDQQPFVIPTLYGRKGETLYLHGSAASRMLKQLATGVPACVTVALVDALVLARSAFNHSMNYRSAVAFGTAKKIMDADEKNRALEIISEHLLAGRWKEVRPPSEKELKATTVLSFAIEECSSKIRSGPVSDDEADYELPVWAGLLPLEIKSLRPIPDSRLSAGVEESNYLLDYDRRFQC
ncbi:MAG: flavin-nucleotide-binding protein [Acidobacteriales bacterium]|nr:flavin-nucleotide-binding protein [Terriglobales bacterium]